MATEKKRKREDKKAKDPSSSPLSSSKSNPNEASPAAEEEEEEEIGLDLISSLPDCILTSILSLLPIRDCVRTSILSSLWRNLWTLAPLEIDSRSLNREDDELTSRRKRQRIKGSLDTILSHHRGPIRTFCVSHRLHRRDGHTLGRWTEILAQRGIQNLSLNCGLPPPRLLTCQSLHSLELLRCDLRKPPALPPYLRELKLWMTRVTENTLSLILSSCRVLDTLELGAYADIGFEFIRFSSPCLRKLIVLDFMRYEVDEYLPSNLLIENAPNLELLMISEYFMHWVKTVKVINAPKLRLLGGVSARDGMIQFGETCFQGELPINFSTRLHNLKTLVIHVNLQDARQAKVLSSLLRYFPCLEVLYILSKDEENSSELADAKYWEQEGSFDCLEHHLKSVKINGFLGNHHDTGFVRFLIQNAKVLKVISLLCDFSLEGKWKETTLRKLLVENKASLNAQVIIMKDQNKGDGFLTLESLVCYSNKQCHIKNI